MRHAKGPDENPGLSCIPFASGEELVSAMGFEPMAY